MSGKKKVLVTFNKETIQLPLEDDGTLSLSTLKGAFSNAVGLFYINAEGNKEGLQILEGHIHINKDVAEYEVRVDQSKKNCFEI